MRLPGLALLLVCGIALAQIVIPPSVATQVVWWLTESGPGFRARLDAVLRAAAALASGVGIAHLQRMLERKSDAPASIAEAHAQLESVYASGATPRDIVRYEVFIGYVPEEIEFGVSVATGEHAEDVVRRSLTQYWYHPYPLSPYFASVEEALRRFYATVGPCPATGGQLSLGWSFALAQAVLNPAYDHMTCPSVDAPPIPMWDYAISKVSYGGVERVAPFHVAGVPDIVVHRDGDDVYGVYGAVEILYLLGYHADASVGVEYCRGGYTIQVWAMVGARYVFDRWEGNKPVGRLAAVVNRGAVFRIIGRLPDQGSTSSVLYAGMSPTYEFALWEAISAGNLVRDAWARACMAIASGGEVRPYPWDVEGAPDSGTAVRQRDAEAVWWLSRPLDWLKLLFAPSVPLTVRFERLQALISERFPFSVAIALRNYVPPVEEDGGLDVPCFAVGHGRELCPDARVLGVVAAGSRWGAALVLSLGVVLWLQRRLVPFLRL